MPWCGALMWYSALVWCFDVVWFSASVWCGVVWCSALMWRGALLWCSVVAWCGVVDALVWLAPWCSERSRRKIWKLFMVIHKIFLFKGFNEENLIKF